MAGAAARGARENEGPHREKEVKRDVREAAGIGERRWTRQAVRAVVKTLADEALTRCHSRETRRQ